jgi:nucleotide-binding universal stress UspA family protein
MRVSEPLGVTARLRMIDPVDWQIRKAEAESYLSGVAARLQNAGLQVSMHLYDGRPAEQIIEVAHSWSADLILISSHGQSGISPWNVSSVVQQVILRAHRSLMIIRAYQPVTEDLTGCIITDLPSVRWFPACGNATDISRISGTCPQR